MERIGCFEQSFDLHEINFMRETRRYLENLFAAKRVHRGENDSFHCKRCDKIIIDELFAWLVRPFCGRVWMEWMQHESKNRWVTVLCEEELSRVAESWKFALQKIQTNSKTSKFETHMKEKKRKRNVPVLTCYIRSQRVSKA